MTVKWENVTIPFTQGMDRSVDDYLASPGAVYTAQNLIVSDKNTLQSTRKYDVAVAEASGRTSITRCVALPDGASAVEIPHTNETYAATSLTSGSNLPGDNERWGVHQEVLGSDCDYFDMCLSASGTFYVCAWVADAEKSDAADTYVNLLVLVASTLEVRYQTIVKVETNGGAVNGLRVCASATLGSNAWAYVVLRNASKVFAFGLTGAGRSVSTVGELTLAESAHYNAYPAAYLPGFDAYENLSDQVTGGALCVFAHTTLGSPSLDAYTLAGTSPPTFTLVTATSSALPVNQIINTNLSLRPFPNGTGQWKFFVAFGVYGSTKVLIASAGDGITTGVDTTTLMTAPPGGVIIDLGAGNYPGRLSFDRNAASITDGTSAFLVEVLTGVNAPGFAYVDAEYTAGTDLSMQHSVNTSVLTHYGLTHTVGVGLAVQGGSAQVVHGHANIRNTPDVYFTTSTQERVVSLGEHDAWAPSQLLKTLLPGVGGPIVANLQPEGAVGFSSDYVGDSNDGLRTGREPVPQMLRIAQGDYLVPHAPASDSVNPPVRLNSRIDRYPANAVSGGSRPALPYVPARRFKLTRVRRSAVLGSAQAVGTTWLAGSSQKCISNVRFGDTLVAPPIIVKSSYDTNDDHALACGANHLFCATFLVPDGNGNYVESAPSPSLHTYSASAYSPTFLLVATHTTTIPGVRLRLYRTVSNNTTTFYLDTEVDAPTALASGVIPATSDTLLTRGEVLYTQRGEQANATPPSCHDIIEHQNRLFCTDGYEIRVTKPLAPGVGPRWFPRSVRIDVPDTFGRAVKLISLDEKLLVFCEKKVGVVDGGGPTLDGLGATFSELSEVSLTGTPWANARSFAQTDDGVWWHSDRGLRLLTRGHAVASGEGGEIGRQVDEIITASTPIIGATNYQGVVRWYLTGTYIQAVTYSQGRFTTEYGTDNTGYGVPSAVCVTTGGKTHLWTATSRLLTYPAALTATPDADITLDTGWIQLDERMEDYQRVRKFMLEGQIRCRATSASSGWTFTVTAKYDYNEDPSLEVTEVSAQLVKPTVIENSESWYRFRAEVPLSAQKCAALRLKITATPTGAARNIRFTGMSLEIGRKRGIGKKLSSTERL